MSTLIVLPPFTEQPLTEISILFSNLEILQRLEGESKNNFKRLHLVLFSLISLNQFSTFSID
jgi:hypothetical protein